MTLCEFLYTSSRTDKITPLPTHRVLIYQQKKVRFRRIYKIAKNIISS